MSRTIFRSEEMTLCQLYLQPESSYATIDELGELGIVQFRDLTPNLNAFQRKFINEVRRCEEMERKLRFLENEIKKDSIYVEQVKTTIKTPTPREIIELEASIEKLDQQVKEINSNADALLKSYNELTELKHNLAMTQHFFEDNNLVNQMIDESGIDDDLELEAKITGQTSSTLMSGMKLGFVTGVIHREKMQSFERMLWRVCRGNIYLKQAEIDQPIEDPTTGNLVHKTVFVVFFQGEQLKNRVQKICEGVRANLYPCPENSSDRRELAMNVMTRLEDLNVVIGQTREHRQRLLSILSKSIRQWEIQIIKIKSIYYTMNLFNHDVARKCFIAECWAPKQQLHQIHQALQRGSNKSGDETSLSVLNELETNESPPTSYQLNKLTRGFQNLVDAYGVGTYREMNPMPFLIITFPFLFAVMFGDAGHGLIVALFALWMIIKEKQLENKWRTQEVWTIFFGGRYIIFFMGIFSIYTGLMYNDVFSKSMNIFGSSWRIKFDDEVLDKSDTVFLEPTSFNYSQNKDYQQMYSGSPYPLGLDPIWQIAENKITFTNSAKMKFAIIVGIFQMGFGVFLSLANHLYFRHYYRIFLEFLPQLLFLVCIFFYLIILIFYKWTHFQGNQSTDAPSLLIHLINMMLLAYPSSPSSSLTFYSFQKTLQTILLLIAVLCIPWMLLGKPIYILLQRRKRRNSQFEHQRIDGEERGNDIEMVDHHQQRNELSSLNNETKHRENIDQDDSPSEVEMSEVWVEQGIHTIEYFLGCISHTASYLRLWALSLAHAQLSEVLWHMVLHIGLSMDGYGGSIALFIVFMPWSSLTVFILLLMEGLSAFLHALRLHWVEFQSKFYKGEGYPFVPFSFEKLIEENQIES